jgi:hypothetical protein
MTKQSTQTKIEDLLRLTSLPDFSKVKNNPDIMESVASSLYGVPESEIITVNFLDTVWSPNTRVYETLFKDGLIKQFYYKKCLESSLSEAVGWTLSNILLGENHNFVASRSETGDWKFGYVAMEDIGTSVTYFNDASTNMSQSFGASLELAKTLSLTDRNNSNLVICENSIIRNVDYETIFNKEYSWNLGMLKDIFKGGYVLGLDAELVSQGQSDARKIIVKNFLDNESLIKDVLTYFSEQSGLQYLDDEKHIEDPFSYMKLYLEAEK